MTEFQEQLASACSKKHSSGNSPQPQKGSVNQASSLLLEGHGLDSLLQRLNKKAKGNNNNNKKKKKKKKNNNKEKKKKKKKKKKQKRRRISTTFWVSFITYRLAFQTIL